MDRLYSTTALLGVRDTLDLPTAWLRDMLFADRVQFVTSEIAFDKLEMDRKLAPFVSPRVAGKARKPRSRTVRTFEPAYVKPKHEVDPSENFVRLEGEQLNGELSPEQRLMLNIERLLEDQDRQITRREEWMCAQVLQTGSVVVEGEDYPAVTIDFARDAELTVVHGPGARWGDNGVSALDDIRDFAALIAEKSGGTATEVILGSKASRLFQKDSEVRSILDNRRQAGGQMQLGPVATGSQNIVAAPLGFVGQFNFWQYSQIYKDDAGVTQQMFPEYGCLVVAPDAFYGAFCHGAIRDNAALQAMARFPKMWNEQDPSVTFLMTQSAPLPVPRDIDATLFATVGADPVSS